MGFRASGDGMVTSLGAMHGAWASLIRRNRLVRFQPQRRRAPGFRVLQSCWIPMAWIPDPSASCSVGLCSVGVRRFIASAHSDWVIEWADVSFR